jgi:hypothetical protein
MMSKVLRSAWKNGSTWIVKDKSGGMLEAMIIGQGFRKGRKRVRMVYKDGPMSRSNDRVTEGDFSHEHMLRFFEPEETSNASG